MIFSESEPAVAFGYGKARGRFEKDSSPPGNQHILQGDSSSSIDSAPQRLSVLGALSPADGGTGGSGFSFDHTGIKLKKPLSYENYPLNRYGVFPSYRVTIVDVRDQIEEKISLNLLKRKHSLHWNSTLNKVLFRVIQYRVSIICHK